MAKTVSDEKDQRPTERSKSRKNPGPTGKQIEKRAAILAEAIRQMNQRGASFLSLNSVAIAVGLSRNTLYYYFKSRVDLIYGCYLMAAESMAQDLRTAHNVDQCADRCLRRFINASLHGERVAVSDITHLNESQQANITLLRQQNEAQLQTLVQRGIDQGSLRPINPAIACQVLLGMLNWSQLSSLWFYGPGAKPNKLAMAAAITDLFLHGIARDKNFQFICTVDQKSIHKTEFNAFDNNSLNEERRRQLLAKAALLFNQRGIDAVSLEDIASHIGTSKGAVYHYYKDKPSLVRACYQQAFSHYDLIIATAEESADSDLEAILSIGHLNCQAQAGEFPPLILQAGESVFCENYTATVNRLAQKMQEMRLRSITAGKLRDFDNYSIEVSSGANFWISRWRKQNPEYAEQLGPIKLANIVSDILSLGLKVRKA